MIRPPGRTQQIRAVLDACERRGIMGRRGVLAGVARHFGVTRQRVWQISKLHSEADDA